MAPARPSAAKSALRRSAKAEDLIQKVMIATAAECTMRVGDAVTLTIAIHEVTGSLSATIRRTSPDRGPAIVHRGDDAGHRLTPLCRQARELLALYGSAAAKVTWTVGQRGSISIATRATANPPPGAIPSDARPGATT